MNCMEVRALVEDALDKSLAGGRKRAFDLHLSRCDECRAFFDAEREEHRRWFQAMNEPEARRHLPNGFADDFIAQMAANHARPQRIWAFVRVFRRIAAMLAAILLFAGLSYAAVTVGERLSSTSRTSSGTDEATAQKGTEATDGTEATGPAISLGPLTVASVIEVSSVASELSYDNQPTTSNSQPEINQGGEEMNIKKKAVTALAAGTLATAPLAASCIVSGSTDRSAQVETTQACDSGLNTFAAPEVRLDGLNLRSDEFVGMRVIIR